MRGKYGSGSSWFDTCALQGKYYELLAKGRDKYTAVGIDHISPQVQQLIRCIIHSCFFLGFRVRKVNIFEVSWTSEILKRRS